MTKTADEHSMQSSHDVSSPGEEKLRPLVVDIDGTLIRSDFFYECLLQCIKHKPWTILALIFWGLSWDEVGSLHERVASKTPYILLGGLVGLIAIWSSLENAIQLEVKSAMKRSACRAASIRRTSAASSASLIGLARFANRNR